MGGFRAWFSSFGLYHWWGYVGVPKISEQFLKSWSPCNGVTHIDFVVVNDDDA